MLAVAPFDSSASQTSRAAAGASLHSIPSFPLVTVIDRPDPIAGEGEILVEIAATALNHADLHQLQGNYPPPPGESEIPGLECSGTIAALGPGVDPASFPVGSRGMALLAGGGHAQRVAVPVGQWMPIPASLSFVEAAALPEAALTAWTNLVAEGEVQAGESVLISGAAGGMGSFAVQIARELGARVFATGRDPERLARVAELGVEVVLEHEQSEQIRALTDGRGVDLVLDFVGGRGFAERVGLLRRQGRAILIGTSAGRESTLDLGVILGRRLRIVGSTLRPRSRAEKAQRVRDFWSFAAARVEDGRLRAIVDRTLPFEAIAEGYRALADFRAARPFGKIVVTT